MDRVDVKPGEYQYSNKPASLLRTLLAVFRIIKDPEKEASDVSEAAVLEIYINESKLGKKLTKWDSVAKELAERFPDVRDAMRSRKAVPWLDLPAMSKMPEGSLGKTYADYAVSRGINPNLLQPVEVRNDGDWLTNHMYATHDFHHLLTGFYYNMQGEWGVTGFYLGQMPKATFFTVMMSVLLFQRSMKRRDELPSDIEAFIEGYQMGKRAKCIMALDYDTVLTRNIDELREELGIVEAGYFPVAMAA